MTQEGMEENGVGGALAAGIGERAAALYSRKKTCCAEAVIGVINEVFGGGLEPELAVRLGAGLCGGMGGAGCVCGALSGGQVALALIAGPGLPEGLKKKEFEKCSKALHDRFKERFGATCCRVLCRWKKEKKGAGCRELTAGGAELVAELLFGLRTGLASRAAAALAETA